MSDAWPSVAMGLLGAYDGINPAMGWPFAVSLGPQDRDRGSVLLALPAIALRRARVRPLRHATPAGDPDQARARVGGSLRPRRGRRAGLVTARALAVLLAALLAGCGSSGDAAGGGGGGSKSPRELFAGSCGSCHTLADAGTSGTFGPDLDSLRPGEQQVRDAIATGPDAMPAGLLEGADAEAVAAYVAGAAGR